jgi:hypothetical protein
MGQTMIIAASTITLDASKPTAPRKIAEMLLTTKAYFATPPWQYTAFSKLHELGKPLSNTRRASDLPVAQSTIMFARTIISDLHHLNVPSPVVCPISGGGVGMVWCLGSKQLEVVFGADQSGSFILSKDDQIIEDGDLAGKSTPEFERALRSIVSV